MKQFQKLLSIIFCLTCLFLNVCVAQSSRDALIQPEKVMDAIGVKPGMVIGEGGAGEGYFTFKLSRRVGETGRVYANDIVERVLGVIERRCEREGIANITTILGEVDDPLFPEGELDMVIMVVAFHDFEEPVAWLENVKPSMKPESTLVIIERDPDKSGRGWNHFISKEEILNTVEKADYKLVKIETFLSVHNVYIFRLK
ncbi:MAG: methyltransferase domain-containing protein [Candidatus Aminicenantes bacterium]|nr:methyltransferase domain-containing protein [Candidatus Aminicenantes bacterium]